MSAAAEQGSSDRLEIFYTSASGVVHDLRGHHAVIRGHCELARLRVEPGTKLADSLQAIEAAVSRACEAGDQLLAFNQNYQPKLVALSIKVLLQDEQRYLRELAGKIVDLEVEAADGLPPVMADPALVRRMLANVILNARYALRDEPLPSIKITARAEADNVVLIVDDNGCGMDMGTLERVRAGSREFTTRPGHTGLGMMVVRQVLEHCRGALRIDSSVGIGTRMEITFPGLGSGTPSA